MTSGSSAECAASAEELSGQAKVLLDLVQRFKIADAASEKKRKKAARAAANALKSDAPAAPSLRLLPRLKRRKLRQRSLLNPLRLQSR